MKPESYQIVRTLFHELCDLPDDERRQRLENLDVDDDIRRELIALLGAGNDSTGFGEEDLGKVGQALLEGELDVMEALSHPERIGPYHVQRRIGEGGMGIVYHGEHETTGQCAAIKVLRPGIGGAHLQGRFSREAKVLEQLSHPGIAAFFEYGEARVVSGDQALTLPYLAMEFIDGVPLLVHAQRENLDDRGRVELICRVCEAVHFAHEHGVIHRDLKPGNILVLPIQGDVGQPKVLDFGVARASVADVHSMTATDSRELLGTIPYMSPEQISDQTAVAAPSDLYSLGVVLYEILAGRLPYDVRGRSVPEAARVIQEEEPTRLGSVSARLRGDLEVIVTKTLEKKPAHRYPDVASLARDLRRYLDGSPIEARPSTWSRQIAKFARHHRVLVTTMCGTFAALVLGLIVALRFAFGEWEARRLADHTAGIARRLAYRTGLDSADAALYYRDATTARFRLHEAPEELRAWEWHHLESRLDSSLDSAVLKGVRGDLQQLLFAEDNRALLALFLETNQNLLTVVRWPMGQEPNPPTTRDNVRGARIDPGGHRLYVREVGGKRSILTLSQGRPEGPPQLLGKDIGKVYPSRSQDVLVHLKNGSVWSTQGDGSAKRLSDPDLKTRFVSVCESGDRVAWLEKSDPSSLRITSPTTLQNEWSIPMEAGELLKLALNRDGTLLSLIRRNDFSVQVWSLTEGQEGTLQSVFSEHEDEVVDCALSPVGPIAASSAQDSVVRLWRSNDAHEIRSFPHPGPPVDHLTFSSDGALLAGSSKQGASPTLRVWSTSEHDLRVLPHGNMLRAAVYSPDGSRILTGSWEDRIRIYDAETALEVGAYFSGPGRMEIRTVLVPPHDEWIVCAERQIETRPYHWRIRVIQTISGEEIFRYTSKTSPSKPVPIALSPDGKTLAARFQDEGLLLFDTSRWDIRARERQPFGPMLKAGSLAFSPDGVLALGLEDGRLAIYDSEDLNTPRTLKPHEGMITALGFHPRRRELVSGGIDAALHVIDLETLSVETLSGQRSKVRGLGYSPDGTRLAIGCDDRVVRLFDTESHEELLRLRGHRDSVWSTVFSPDGQRLVTASGDKTARLWDLRSNTQRHDARRDYRDTWQSLEQEVHGLLEAQGPTAAAATIRSRQEWTDREREIALQIVLRQTLSPLLPSRLPRD